MHSAIRSRLKVVAECKYQGNVGGGAVVHALLGAGMKPVKRREEIWAMFTSVDGRFCGLSLNVMYDNSVRCQTSVHKMQKGKRGHLIAVSGGTGLMADDELVAIGEIDVQEFMSFDETTEWKREMLARAFASLPHPYVLKFQSAVPAEGSASGVAAARRNYTDYTFDVDAEVQRRSQAGRVVPIISDNSNNNSSGRAYGDCSGALRQAARGTPSSSSAFCKRGQTPESASKWAAAESVDVPEECTPGSQGQRKDWTEHGVCNGVVTGRFTGRYKGRLVAGERMVIKPRSCASDANAIELWDSCGKATNSACAGYLDRHTAALVSASLADGDTVEVEYVGIGESRDTGRLDVEVVRLLRSPPAARRATKRTAGGVKRAVSFGEPPARESVDGSNSEDNSSDTRKYKARRVSAGAYPRSMCVSASIDRIEQQAALIDLLAFELDHSSDSEDSDDDEDGDAAQTRTTAQLQYERIPIVEQVVVGMRVMGHWNDIDGWYPATVIEVFAAGDAKFRIIYDGDDEESDVSNERLGQMV